MSEVLHRAVSHLLKPLVKAMINHGITYPLLANLVRQAYVEIAQSDFGINGKPPTDSRIAVLTGVHRKEIRRLRLEECVDHLPPENISLSAKVIAVWCSKPEYLNDQQRPRVLPRTAPVGEPSFEQLVASVSVDVRPRTLLEEWRRSGVVELRDGGVALVENALVPNKGFEEKAFYFGRNLSDHIAAGTHNLSGAEPIFLDRAVYYDRISPDSIERLRKLCAQRGDELLLEINRCTRRLAEQDRAADRPQGRMAFGVYFFSEDETENLSTKAERYKKKK